MNVFKIISRVWAYFIDDNTNFSEQMFWYCVHTQNSLKNLDKINNNQQKNMEAQADIYQDVIKFPEELH
jgi:hypothetical protein